MRRCAFRRENPAIRIVKRRGMGKGKDMGMRWTILAGFAAALAHAALAQTAALPATYTGPWRDAPPMAGWTFSGLGSPDYNHPDFDGLNDGAAKLDGTGDFISIDFDSPPETLSFWIKSYVMTSGGVFRVEQSLDGTNWLELASYEPPPATATFQSFALSYHARHVRFRYAEKITGNVGLDGIAISKNLHPVIAHHSLSNAWRSFSIAPSDLGRTYELYYTTNLVHTNWQMTYRMEGNGEPELELRDYSFEFPRYYQVRSFSTPSGKKTVLPRRTKPAWRRPPP